MGVYDEQGNRWVNVDGQRVLCYTLNIMNRLARSQPPWCLLHKKVQKSIFRQVKRAIRHIWSLDEKKTGLERGALNS